MIQGLSDARIAPEAFTMNHFLKMVICRLNGKALQESMGIGRDGRLPEAVYQHEFYRVASEVIPYGCTISPNVGAVWSELEK